SHTDDIGRNDLVLVISVGLGCGGFHLSVDLVNGNISFHNCGQDGGGSGGGRYTLSGADELAVQFRNNQTDCLCRAGAVGNDVHSGRTGSSQIALSLGSVQSHLITGVGMDGNHDTGLDGCQLVQSLCHGSQAVGGAGCRRDYSIGGFQGLMVYIVNDGGQIVSCGSRDNNLSCACLNVGLGFCLGGVEAGALQNNVNFQLSPGKIGSVSLFVDLDGLAVNGDGSGFLIRANGISQSVFALRRIIFQQMRQHLGRCQIVNCYYFV